MNIEARTADTLTGKDLYREVILHHPGYDKFKHWQLVGIAQSRSGVMGKSNVTLHFINDRGAAHALTVAGETKVTVYEEDES